MVQGSIDCRLLLKDISGELNEEVWNCDAGECRTAVKDVKSVTGTGSDVCRVTRQQHDRQWNLSQCVTTASQERPDLGFSACCQSADIANCMEVRIASCIGNSHSL